MRTIRYGGLLIFLLLQLSSCGLKYQPIDLGDNDYPDLDSTPFFPQEKYQCGPASLAMVLAASGVDVQPEELVALTYVPEKQGSFQLELLAAARTYGRIPYVINPELNALAAELVAGRPVLVLQNYGLESLPSYHYAVAIGLLPGEKIILRSGTSRRRVMDIPLFLMSWLRPGAWAFVVLRPGELPENADLKRYLQALAAFEKANEPAAVFPAYQAALARWPEDPLLLFALGNNALRRNNLREAEEFFRRVLDRDDKHLGAMNNLADILARRGCYRKAEDLINRAAAIAQQEASVFTDLIMITKNEIAGQSAAVKGQNALLCQ